MDPVTKKRKQNEQKFKNWVETDSGGRKYWYDALGRNGRTARYVKEVDENEVTQKFYQEVYDHIGRLIEIHEKYPIDKGHKPVEAKDREVYLNGANKRDGRG